MRSIESLLRDDIDNVFGEYMRFYIEVGTQKAIIWQVDEKEPYAAGRNSLDLDSWEQLHQVIVALSCDLIYK